MRFVQIQEGNDDPGARVGEDRMVGVGPLAFGGDGARVVLAGKRGGCVRAGPGGWTDLPEPRQAAGVGENVGPVAELADVGAAGDAPDPVDGGAVPLFAVIEVEGGVSQALGKLEASRGRLDSNDYNPLSGLEGLTSNFLRFYGLSPVFTVKEAPKIADVSVTSRPADGTNTFKADEQIEVTAGWRHRGWRYSRRCSICARSAAIRGW